MSGKYEDLLHRPHPISARHPRMSAENRAAQFAPFAALTGYEAEIRETARLTDSKIQLSEDDRQLLDRKQQILREHLPERPAVTLIYFEPDDRKEGGQYNTVCGQVRKVDEIARTMTLTDGTELFLDDIFTIESELFKELEAPAEGEAAL